MNLVMCINCNDIINPAVRNVCTCGLTTTTINDGVVVYKGLYAVPVVLGERSMVNSLEYYRKFGVSTCFSGWFPYYSTQFRKEK